MRASSLSDAKVIALLNRYFVPVYASNEDDVNGGSAPALEKLEYQRILFEAGKAGLSTGSVYVYLLTPDGHPLDSLHVAEACKPDELRPRLEQAVKKLRTSPGAPLVKAIAQSKPPPHEADSLVLHLIARVVTPG